MDSTRVFRSALALRILRTSGLLAVTIPAGAWGCGGAVVDENAGVGGAGGGAATGSGGSGPTGTTVASSGATSTSSSSTSVTTTGVGGSTSVSSGVGGAPVCCNCGAQNSVCFEWPYDSPCPPTTE